MMHNPCFIPMVRYWSKSADIYDRAKPRDVDRKSYLVMPAYSVNTKPDFKTLRQAAHFSF